MKLSSEQLRNFQSLVGAGELLPPGDDYFTFREWSDIMKENSIFIGQNKLRAILNHHGQVFHGVGRTKSGKLNRQVWYKMNLDEIA